MVCLVSMLTIAQTTPIHITFLSHNEPADSIDYDTDSLGFVHSTTFVKAFADTIISKNAAWNLQTASKYLLGVMYWQDAGNDTADILEWMDKQEQIEVDTRNKRNISYPYNAADIAFLLDSIGLKTPRRHVGIVYYPDSVQDWTVYNDGPINGAVFPFFQWRPEFGTGGGSPWHVKDDSTFGVWKPRAANDYYTHEPSNHIYYVGTGCVQRITEETDPDTLAAFITDLADKIATGLMPQDKFYPMKINIHQTDLSASTIQKAAAVIDLLAPLVSSGQVIWSTYSKTFDRFQTWSNLTSQDYSQFACSDVPAGSVSGLGDPVSADAGLSLFPNPAEQYVRIAAPGQQLAEISLYNLMGQELKRLPTVSTSQYQLGLSDVPPGIHIIRVVLSNGDQYTRKLTIQ